MYAWKEKHPARTITVNGLWEPPPTAFADDHAYAEKTKKKRNIQVAKVITWAAPAEVIEVPDVSDDPATEKQEEVQQEEVQQQGSEEQQEEVQEEQEERPLKKSDLMYAVSISESSDDEVDNENDPASESSEHERTEAAFAEPSEFSAIEAETT